MWRQVRVTTTRRCVWAGCRLAQYFILAFIVAVIAFEEPVLAQSALTSIALDTTMLDFGTLPLSPVGGGKSLRVQVTNIGAQTFDFSTSITERGFQLDPQSTSCTTGGSSYVLLSGDSCFVGVIFQPSFVGPANSTLVVGGNGARQEVSLMGEGVSVGGGGGSTGCINDCSLPPSATPELDSLVLFGAGLFGLARYALARAKS